MENIAKLISYLCLTACLASCNGGNDDREPSLFTNGYLLEKEIATTPFTTESRTRSYIYDFKNRQIDRTTVETDGSTKRAIIYFDASGRLTGGNNLENSDDEDYVITYQPDGLVQKFSESAFDNSIYEYADGRLDRITRILTPPQLVETRNIWQFNYSDAGVLQSTFSDLSNTSADIEYNENSQVVSVSEKDNTGAEVQRYAYTYDDAGNVIGISTFDNLGALAETIAYEYKKTPETIFNHGIMRLMIEPFNRLRGVIVQ